MKNGDIVIYIGIYIGDESSLLIKGKKYIFGSFIPIHGSTLHNRCYIYDIKDKVFEYDRMPYYCKSKDVISISEYRNLIINDLLDND